MSYRGYSRRGYSRSGGVGSRSVFAEKMSKTISAATATNTYDAWKMPVSKTGRIIMAIHQIQYSMMYDTTHFTSIQKGDGQYVHIQLTREEEALVVDEDDDDLIDHLKIDQNMTTSGQSQSEWPKIHKFYPPLAQTRNEIHLHCIQNTGITMKVTARIYYTLVRVSQSQLVSRLINEEE